MFFPQGRVYLVELKRKGEKLSPIQEVWHSRLRQMGHSPVVLHGRSEIIEWLRQTVDSMGPQNNELDDPDTQ